jgi:hypothetical protein
VNRRFYLYERRRSGKPPVWYVRFRKPDGSVTSPVSSGQAEKAKAEAWALEQLLAGEGRLPARSPGNPTFAEWAADWWVYDRCPYIAEKRADGYNISKNYADGRRRMLQQYLIPALGDVPLRQLAPRHFRDLKMSLLEAGKLLPGTINRIIGTTSTLALKFTIRWVCAILVRGGEQYGREEIPGSIAKERTGAATGSGSQGSAESEGNQPSAHTYDG